jgi:hypothetical protein
MDGLYVTLYSSFHCSSVVTLWTFVTLVVMDPSQLHSQRMCKGCSVVTYSALVVLIFVVDRFLMPSQAALFRDCIITQVTFVVSDLVVNGFHVIIYSFHL